METRGQSEQEEPPRHAYARGLPTVASGAGGMPCYRPLTARRTTEGTIAFDDAGSSLTTIQLPCGRCIGCRLDRARDWTIRCIHEAQLHEPRNCFLTLTYNDAHLPPDESLDVRDWQTFAKRLRHQIGPFRFFHVGEYGDENLRPHYHALLFGQDFAEDRIAWTRNQHGDPIYTSDTLDKTWGLGFATISDVTWTSAAYCARYALKKITGPQAAEHYTRIDYDTGEIWNVKPEYATMSRRPGLGKQWLEQYADEIYPDDAVRLNGALHPPPRYYDQQLPDQELETLKTHRRKAVASRADDLTPERLAIKEEATELRMKATTRRV